MLTVGDVCPNDGFVTAKRNVYVVPAANCPLCTVSVNVPVPALHAPLDGVMPSENFVSPSSPASNSVTGLVATALSSPEIVTTELSAAVRLTFVAIVTVMKFVALATGVLCPIAMVVKLCADALTRKLAAPNRTSIPIIPLLCLRLVRLQCGTEQQSDASTVILSSVLRTRRLKEPRKDANIFSRVVGEVHVCPQQNSGTTAAIA